MFNIVLKNLREDRNLLQSELAEFIGVSKSTIGMYEAGKRMPNDKILKKLADFFEVSIDFLLGFENEKKQYNLLVSDEDINEIKKKTALSDKAILAIQNFALTEPFGMIHLNALLEDLMHYDKKEKSLLYKLILYLHYSSCPDTGKMVALLSNNTLRIVGKKTAKGYDEFQRTSEAEIIKKLLLDNLTDGLKKL